jgi:DNA-binding Lrp family transcriptional regulator
MDMRKDSRFENALIEVISQGLPLVSHPYAAIAEQLGCNETQVIEGINRIMMRGDMKRFGVVVRHRKLGCGTFRMHALPKSATASGNILSLRCAINDPGGCPNGLTICSA